LSDVAWLDIVYRVEKAFEVTLTAEDFAAMTAENRVSLTAGALWELIVAKQRPIGVSIAADSWERLTMVLSEALNVRPNRIAAESHLYSDLGMGNSFE